MRLAGLEFYEQSTEGLRKVVNIQGKDWVCKRDPAGGWMTLRELSEDERRVLDCALRRLHLFGIDFQPVEDYRHGRSE